MKERFLNYLDAVRARPVAERQRLAVVWALGGTIAIALLWLGNSALVAYAKREASPTAGAAPSAFAGALERIQAGWHKLIN